jgi:hypothetical protein
MIRGRPSHRSQPSQFQTVHYTAAGPWEVHIFREKTWSKILGKSWEFVKLLKKSD